MQLFYNNVDILTNKDVALSSCAATDNASGQADILDMVFSDTAAFWGVWQPQKGDEIIFAHDGWSTGKTYIDYICDTDTAFKLSARSLPPKAKQSGSTAWEYVRFSKIASDLAIASGLELSLYNITDYNYVRFDRKNESSLQALNRLCIREGYALKITNGKAVIYNEKSYENATAIKTIYPSKYYFEGLDIGKQSVNIKWVDGKGNLIQGVATDTSINLETEFITSLPVYNTAEAERFAKGYLRQFNKGRTIGQISTDRDLSLAAGNVIYVSVMGMFAGNYFIEQIKHEFVGGAKSQYKLRKAIEGDY